MPDSAVAITAGAGTNIDTFTDSAGNHRQVVVLGNKGAYEGFASTFRIPGLAGTAGQKIFALHNATGSTVVVDVKSIRVCKTETVIMAVTVLPPVIRLYKITAVPTGGTALTKVARDSAATATNASLTAWQGASADGTGTSLTVTLPANTVVSNHFAPRYVTAVGRVESIEWELIPKGTSVVLRALEGVCVHLDYVAATQNAITDMWTVQANWEEYVA